MSKIIFYIKKAWAPTVIVTVIFFAEYFWFGMENTLIAPFAALTFLRLLNMKRCRDCLVRNFLIYGVMAVLAAVALVNLPLCIMVNGIALFWIAYFLIDEFSPTNYFPSGMALIFFQISPVSGTPLSGLGRRLAGLAVAFAIILIFLMIREQIHRQQKQPDPLETLAARGLELCELLVNGEAQGGDNVSRLEFGENASRLDSCREELCRINRQLSRNVYEQNRSALNGKVADNRYCSFIALFQVMSYSDPEDKALLKKLMNSCRKILENTPRNVERRIRVRTNRLDLRSFRLRFALRQVLILTPCLVFAYAGGLPNSYWLAISVFFMMIPLYERTPGRIAQRMTGTFAGLLMCIVLFAIFRTMPERILLMTFFNFLIYCSGSYATMVACITCSALALNFSQDNYLMMLVQRLLYTLAGALIAWIANTWIFPIRARRQMTLIREILELVRSDAAKAHALPGEQKICELNRLIVTSYLFSNRMEDLNQTLPEGQRDENLTLELQSHMAKLAAAIAAEL